MPAETSPRTSSVATNQHRTKRRRATYDQLAKHTEHLVPRQRLQEAHGTEAPPLPGPGDLGFSPGTLPGDGDPHDASREDHGARRRRRRRAGQASQGFRPVPHTIVLANICHIWTWITVRAHSKGILLKAL
jgi:hypothetical protein